LDGCVEEVSEKKFTFKDLTDNVTITDFVNIPDVNMVAVCKARLFFTVDTTKVTVDTILHSADMTTI
jgi:hypothetical protein